jgi:exodeoxyribonuclease-3
MFITTWNVNSIRAREERLLAWLKEAKPDVVCLQETKVVDDHFPFDSLKDVGYHAVTWGQKTYNGVAILSLAPLEDVERGTGGDTDNDQARLIAATVNGIRVISAYFPNGRTVDDEKYQYKQEWMDRLLAKLGSHDLETERLVLAGDFNIVPDERDVNRVEEWTGSVLYNPEMSAYFQKFLDLGLLDTFRLHNEEAGLYSWWDYRMLGFPKNNGLRIDHILASKALAAESVSARIERDMRKGKKPSDHTVVWAGFEGR